MIPVNNVRQLAVVGVAVKLPTGTEICLIDDFVPETVKTCVGLSTKFKVAKHFNV